MISTTSAIKTFFFITLSFCKVHTKKTYSQAFRARLYEMVKLVYEMVVEHKIHPLTAHPGTDEVGGMFHFRPRADVIPSVERDPASVSRRQPPCPAASSLALLGNDNSTLKISKNSKPNHHERNQLERNPQTPHRRAHRHRRYPGRSVVHELTSTP